jgi:ATP-dependent DNA ligase
VILMATSFPFGGFRMETSQRIRDPRASLPDLITAVKALGLEGLVAKRWDSRYEPRQRSGA